MNFIELYTFSSRMITAALFGLGRGFSSTKGIAPSGVATTRLALTWAAAGAEGARHSTGLTIGSVTRYGCTTTEASTTGGGREALEAVAPVVWLEMTWISRSPFLANFLTRFLGRNVGMFDDSRFGIRYQTSLLGRRNIWKSLRPSE